MLAAAVTRGQGQIDAVSVLRTWPWEFDIFHWCQRFRGPLDPVPGGRRRDVRGQDGVFPEFTPYEPSRDDGVQFGDASEFAAQLRQSLRLPAGHALYVIAI